MTRKRYVKLLMARGYSRNDANLRAERALSRGRSFRQDYDCLLVGDGGMEGLLEGFEAVKRAFSAVAAAIREGFAAFEKTYQAAMDKEKEPEG